MSSPPENRPTRTEPRSLMHSSKVAALLLTTLVACRQDPGKTTPDPQAELHAARQRILFLDAANRSKDQELETLKQALASRPMPVSQPALEYRNATGEPEYVGGLVLLARDPDSGDLGWIAFSTCPAGAAQIVAGRAGVGLVATFGNPLHEWHRQGLEALAQGQAANAVLQDLCPDPSTHRTQALGVLDATGRTAGRLGLGVRSIAEDVHGDGFYIAGSELMPLQVVDRLKDEFLKTAGLPLPERLLVATREVWDFPKSLAKGIPGVVTDPRNRPAVSAALVVLRKSGSIDGSGDRLVDLRVDFDREPLAALEFSYPAWVQASLVARLKVLQRAFADPDSPAARANAQWLDRIRQRLPVGQRK